MGEPIDSLREESLRLFTKLENLNTRITALEIRCRSEQDARGKISKTFNVDPNAKTMTLDHFEKYFKTNFGVELDKHLYKNFRQEVNFGSLDENTIDANCL